jgi:hypothetical protein
MRRAIQCAWNGENTAQSGAVKRFGVAARFRAMRDLTS